MTSSTERPSSPPRTPLRPPSAPAAGTGKKRNSDLYAGKRNVNGEILEPPPPGTPTPGVFHALVATLEAMARFDSPADRTLTYTFREYRNLVSRERAKVADVAYAWLRHYASFTEHYPSSTPRRWAIAALKEYAGMSVAAAAYHGSKGDASWLRERLSAEVRKLTPAQLHECPDWLWERLVAQEGEAAASTLMKTMQFPARFDLRVNTLKAKRDDVLARFAAEGLAAEPTPYAPHGIRFAQAFPLQNHALYTSGAVEVQDEGSQLLAQLVGAKRTEMVGDFCAGAGGKTLAIGAMMSSTGRLYAMDVDEKRLKNLNPRMNRAGLTNVHPMLIDSETDSRLKRLAAKFDRVLVDAPCSGLGTLRRNPDLKWRQTAAGVEEMNAKQLRILRAAAKLVKPGGRLVYATCSILREENEGIAEAFLKLGGFTQLPAAQILGRDDVGGDYLRLSPVTHGCDGFFACVMERDAEKIAEKIEENAAEN
jgi:16S rRNA (cytosine967-C5)-methyltransferase